MPVLCPESIAHRTLIKADRETVYKMITTAEGWDSFFTVGTELDLSPGGTMILNWDQWGPDKVKVKATCNIVRYAPPVQFVFQWYPIKSDPTHPTTIEIKLIACENDTIVDLQEFGYPDSSEGLKMMLECAVGWGEALTLLKFYIEHKVRY